MDKLTLALHQRLPAWAAEWVDILVPLIQVTLIVMGAWLLMRVARHLTRRLTAAYALPLRVTSIFLRTVGVIVYLGALLWALERLGVSGGVLWTAFTGFATVGAVAFFAAWSVLSNLFCALLIYVTRAFRIGDVVELLESGDKPGLKGQVVDINPVYTTLHETGNAESGSSLQLPNSLFFQRALRRWHGAAAGEAMAQGGKVE
ncbi:MAG: mechanosensitive ion channel family protein [Rhizobacter sp.]